MINPEKILGKITRGILLALALCGIVILTIFVVSKDNIIYKFQQYNQKPPGYPQTIPGQAKYSAAAFEIFSEYSGLINIINDSYIYSYDKGGTQKYALMHSYRNPVFKTNQNRALMYDVNGRKFTVYSKNGIVFEENFDFPVQYCDMYYDNTIAAVCIGETSEHIFYVYDKNKNLKYQRIFADKHIWSVSKPEKLDNFYMVIYDDFINGFIQSYAVLIDITVEDEKEGVIWKTELPLDSLPLISVSDDKTLTVLCDNALVFIDIKTGKNIRVNDFNNQVILSPFLSYGEENQYLITQNEITGKVILNAYTNSYGYAGSIEINGNYRNIRAKNGKLYMLDFEGKRIYLFEISDFKLTQNLLFSKENEIYKDFVITENDLYLFTENEIIKADS